MANTEHRATSRNKRSGAKVEFLRAEQRSNHNVTTGLHATIGTKHDAATQVVLHENLMRLGDPNFPSGSGVLDRSEWRGTSATIVTRYEHHIGVSFGHTRGHRADA